MMRLQYASLWLICIILREIISMEELGYFKTVSGYFGQLPSIGILSNYSSVGMIGCALKCLEDTRCVSIFYNPVSSGIKCHGFQYRLTDKYPSIVKYNAPGWGYYPMKTDCEHSDYSYDRELNMCFKVYSVEKTHIEAESTCKGDGGQLVSLHTYNRAQFIKSFLRTYVTIRYHWIGLTDIKTEGSWVFSNGERFTENLKLSFQFNNFDSTFQDSRRFNADCACLSAWANTMYDLLDQNCDKRNPFICEILF